MSGQKPFEVIFEDNHLLVVNKSSGVLVQGDATGDTPLVELCKSYIKEKHHKPGAVFMGVVHRLDRPVSGIVVLARTSKGLERMNALFREKQTTKIYWAIVKKEPQQREGTLIHWLLKDEKKNKTTAFTRETDGAQRSELSYQVIGNAVGCWLLEVRPVTGRSHQIRVQLASMGCPIKGDLKYGDDHANEDGSICLHARQLHFIHPVKKDAVVFTAPLPPSGLWKYFLKFSS
ncbi:MAG: RluA family pseudouridine synthase [Cyclobacteriaceae bacterium]|nr:RluA family pseudouridine synthase [Cyclobacteriaceae bacterium]